MWYRIFAARAAPVPADDLAAQVQRIAPGVRCDFRGDDAGWFRVELTPPGSDAVAELDQYAADEDGIRHQLNSWAAWLEAHDDNAHSAALMRRVIQSAQIFVLLVPPGSRLDGAALARWLAAQTGGVFQADGSGFHDADGTPLVAEAT